MKRILIVEDDPVGKVVLQKMLERDFLCDIASTGEEALQLAGQQIYAALVLDINLGDDEMDGCCLLKAIRQLDGYSSIRAVATTAYAMSGDRERFLESGFDAYISKPIRMQELLDTVNDILD